MPDSHPDKTCSFCLFVHKKIPGYFTGIFIFIEIVIRGQTSF